ncbi:photosystem reaction center subunit H [Moraxella atlantae]|uniref:Photosystem reaction center subunit H n=1 Tax=Faucicola atlantae TaxID=34059 RepID=A0A1B8QAT8_9GAMM|nr:PRC and DUF2382 domain-containing protein [Moraxella atlantae]OBX76505.1 photosystem reaction center subunit H [Moraxella atlantae]
MANLMRLRDIQDSHPDVLGNDYFDPTGRTAYGVNNDKIGKIDGALVDDTTGRIRYFIVDVGGWFSSKEVLVPAGLARIAGDEVYFDNLTKDVVEGMDQYDPDYNYSIEQQVVRDRQVFEKAPEPVQLTEEQYKAPNTLELLEERLTVNKDKIVAGLLRVGKHVVSEDRQVNVDLTEEQAHIDRTPVNRPTDRQIGDDSQTVEVQLEAERANVQKQTYVTEEVNVDKVAQTRTQTFNETVRREELDVQQDGVERVAGTTGVNTTDDLNRR